MASEAHSLQPPSKRKTLPVVQQGVMVTPSRQFSVPVDLAQAPASPSSQPRPGSLSPRDSSPQRSMIGGGAPRLQTAVVPPVTPVVALRSPLSRASARLEHSELPTSSPTKCSTDGRLAAQAAGSVHSLSPSRARLSPESPRATLKGEEQPGAPHLSPRGRDSIGNTLSRSPASPRRSVAPVQGNNFVAPWRVPDSPKGPSRAESNTWPTAAARSSTGKFAVVAQGTGLDSTQGSWSSRAPDSPKVGIREKHNGSLPNWAHPLDSFSGNARGSAKLSPQSPRASGRDDVCSSPLLWCASPRTISASLGSPAPESPRAVLGRDLVSCGGATRSLPTASTQPSPESPRAQIRDSFVATMPSLRCAPLRSPPAASCTQAPDSPREEKDACSHPPPWCVSPRSLPTASGSREVCRTPPKPRPPLSSRGLKNDEDSQKSGDLDATATSCFLVPGDLCAGSDCQSAGNSARPSYLPGAVWEQTVPRMHRDSPLVSSRGSSAESPSSPPAEKIVEEPAVAHAAKQRRSAPDTPKREDGVPREKSEKSKVPHTPAAVQVLPAAPGTPGAQEADGAQPRDEAAAERNSTEASPVPSVARGGEDSDWEFETSATKELWLQPVMQTMRRAALGLINGRASAFCDGCDHISLGSYCAVARALQAMGLKKHSYPFDWTRSPLDGIIRLFETDFAGFLSFALDEDRAELGHLKGNAPWGGSFWHHDVSQPQVRHDFRRRINRLLGDDEVPMLRPRVFVRAVNSTSEVALTIRLHEALRRTFPGGRVYVLMLIDCQPSSGLLRLTDSTLDNVLFCMLRNEKLFEDNGKCWTMERQCECYAEAIALATRYWGGKADASSEIREVASLQQLSSLVMPFEGGKAGSELFFPRRATGLQLPQDLPPSRGMELTQSMKNAASRSSRTCSPRPAGKSVKFNLEDCTYQVYDVDGKEMADDRRPKQAKSTIQSLQGVSCDGTAGAGKKRGRGVSSGDVTSRSTV